MKQRHDPPVVAYLDASAAVQAKVCDENHLFQFLEKRANWAGGKSRGNNNVVKRVKPGQYEVAFKTRNKDYLGLISNMYLTDNFLRNQVVVKSSKNERYRFVVRPTPALAPNNATAVTAATVAPQAASSDPSAPTSKSTSSPAVTPTGSAHTVRVGSVTTRVPGSAHPVCVGTVTCRVTQQSRPAAELCGSAALPATPAPGKGALTPEPASKRPKTRSTTSLDELIDGALAAATGEPQAKKKYTPSPPSAAKISRAAKPNARHMTGANAIPVASRKAKSVTSYPVLLSAVREDTTSPTAETVFAPLPPVQGSASVSPSAISTQPIVPVAAMEGNAASVSADFSPLCALQADKFSTSGSRGIQGVAVLPEVDAALPDFSSSALPQSVLDRLREANATSDRAVENAKQAASAVAEIELHCRQALQQAAATIHVLLVARVGYAGPGRSGISSPSE